MFLDAPPTSVVRKVLDGHLRTLKGIITVVERDIHAGISEPYIVRLTIPSRVCDETNVLVDAPSASIIAKAIDDFDSSDVDGITQDNDPGETKPNDICDADTDGGHRCDVEVSDKGK